MSQYTLPLPQKENKHRVLSDSLRRLIRSGLQARDRRMVEWQICDLWTRGLRDPAYAWQLAQSNVVPSFIDETGQLEFTLEYALEKFRTEKGRFGKIDLSPLVEPKGFGLNSIRSRGTAQAVLESLLSDQAVRYAKAQTLPLMLKASLVGIGGWVEQYAGKTYGRLEVIHGKELLPIPSRVESEGELLGICRRRQVPLEWLKKQDGFDIPKTSEETHALDVKFLEYGTVPDTSMYTRAGTHDAVLGEMETTSEDMMSQPPDTMMEKLKRGAPVVYLDEFFLKGPENLLARYIAHVGRTVIADSNYEAEGQRVPFPIGLVRYNDIGDFYGRTFLYPLLTLNKELEETYKVFIQMVQDANWLGFTLLPTTMGISDRDFKETNRMRIIAWEPTWDLGTSRVDPFQIKPESRMGAFPLNVATQIQQMLDLQSGQSAIYQGDAPGRVDSAASINALTELGNTSLVDPIDSLVGAFSQAYLHILYKAKEMMKQGEALNVRSVDLKILGVTTDPQSGSISLENNPIPDWEEVSITVESTKPKSRGARMAELNEQEQLGRITKSQYRIISRIENLDLPIASDAEWETYRTTMFNIRSLFRDGKTPGEALMDTSHDVIPIALEYLMAFRASTECKLASQAVRQAFDKVIRIYRQAMGRYPDQLPSPEMLSELAPIEGEQDASGMPEGAF